MASRRARLSFLARVLAAHTATGPAKAARACHGLECPNRGSTRIFTATFKSGAATSQATSPLTIH
eukprot:1332747-Rhodomonas_salina.1